MSQRRSALGRGLGALISNPNQNRKGGDSGTERPTRSSVTPSAANPAGAGTQSGVAPNPVPTTAPNQEAGASAASAGPREIAVSLIDPNPEQPRREFKPDALKQLAESIGEHGVLQPVVVRRAGERFELIMGERRFRASQLAGRGTVPAVVVDVDPSDRLELAIVENVQRQDLNPVELALAYQALADAGHTQAEIGQKVSMDRSSVANHLRLLDLSKPILTDLEQGRLSMGHAKALLQVADLPARERLREQIAKQGLSVRNAEKLAREIEGGPRKPAGPSEAKSNNSPLDPDTRAYVERIERRLQTKVTIHPGRDGSGRLEIRYFNLEDLERLGGLLLGEQG